MQWTAFCFKNKTQLWHVAGEWHKYKKKMQARSRKKESLEGIFHISFNHC